MGTNDNSQTLDQIYGRLKWVFTSIFQLQFLVKSKNVRWNISFHCSLTVKNRQQIKMDVQISLMVLHGPRIRPYHLQQNQPPL